MRAFVLALAAAALCAVRGASAESASSDMVIVELNRAIDVSGQVRGKRRRRACSAYVRLY